MGVFRIGGAWTDTELADLDRVKDRLRAKGLTDIESGLTDYGDPWLAVIAMDVSFCTSPVSGEPTTTMGSASGNLG